MKTILLIIPYFGKWPVWFEAYLVSIQKNPSVNWLFITDCELPLHSPSNTEFISSSLSEFNDRVNAHFGVNVPLSPRKICDLRVAFGELFSAELQNYDFWGFCDLDIIWGDIRAFITPEKLEYYDLISSRKHNTSGHFTIVKNTPANAAYYHHIFDYKELLQREELQRIDEDGLTAVIQEKNNLKVDWHETLLNHDGKGRAHQEYVYDRWKWDQGKVINTQTGQEVMYLHFINWKRTMQYSEIYYDDQPKHFYISFNGMHYQKHTKFKKYFRTIINIFDGYYAIIYRKKMIRKIKKKIST